MARFSGGAGGGSGTPGPTGPQGPAGADGEGFSYRGDFNISTQYYANDVVRYNNEDSNFDKWLWIALTDTVGHDVLSGSDRWVVFLEAGADGPAGADGAPGADGPAGADGAPGADGPAGADGGFSSTQTLVVISSTPYTLNSSSAGKLFITSPTSNVNDPVTVIAQGLLSGQQVDFIQWNDGQITFQAGSGVTLFSKDGKVKTTAEFSVASIKCISDDGQGGGTYLLAGDLGD
jgi:hypothetical protein